MPRLLLSSGLLAALALAAACEQRFSADPPPGFPATLGPAPSSSASPLEALLAPAPDGGAAMPSGPHAMTILSCAADAAACTTAGADGTVDGTYRVLFGSGRGVNRSRNQAMTDIYKELRDRLVSGQHLDAEPRERPDGGAVHPVTNVSSTSEDPLTDAAMRLMDWVDAVGGVTLDTMPWGSEECRVAVGSRGAGRALGVCLVNAPPRKGAERGSGKGGR